MLERLWVLLEQRKVKIPDDVKADYQALKVKGSQGKKIENPKTKTERKAERLRVDRLHKGPEEGKAKQTTFLLHTPDGEMYDARKSILIADEAGEEDVPDEQMTAEDAAAIEHADFMKNGSSYQPRALTLPSGLTAKNVVAGVKRRSNTSNPFATLKKPKRVVDSLVDIYQSYQKIALQAAEVNEYLRTLRADSITNAALIGVLKNVQSVAKQYLAARKVHDIAFKAALRIPAHSDPLVLEEFVATDAKAYMTMTTEWSSKTFMAMKSAPNMSVAMGKVLEDQIQGVKKSNPGLAERMSK
ncbi:hypothetical protein J4E91_004185 [Alternaria rosae]|nr:hypothetical protein J4E91_004185 [Alternaria rosae]